MGKGSAPKAPDPKETAAAQTATNIATAQANAALNNVNQITPYGSLTYSQTGSQFISDPNGGVYWYNPSTGEYRSAPPGGASGGGGTTRSQGKNNLTPAQLAFLGVNGVGGGSGSSSIPEGWQQVRGNYIPTYTATQTLSPEQQKIFDQTQAAQLNLGRLANQQSARLIDYMANPVNLSRENVENYINDHFSDDFNSQWGQRQTDYETQLANQGIRMGSSAYTRAMNDFSTQRSNAYDNMYGNQYAQAANLLLTERNQPLNEIASLLSGSQIQNPSFVNTPQHTIPTTDYAGIVQQDYQNRLGAWQQQQQTMGGILGGLFGLGGKLIGLSDETAKKDKERLIDLDDNGTGLWAFRYKGEPGGSPKHIGLMAQEVEEIDPNAVLDGYPDGYKRVNYGRAISSIIGGA